MFSDASLNVQEFHAFFNGIIRTAPTRITGKELELRKNLIREEYEELMEALDGDDLRQVYKEAADLLYVLYGLDAHIGGRLDDVFAEVHRANMDKLWDCDKCDGTGLDESYGCSKCEAVGKVAVYREDGKVLKPDDYEKADLSFIPEDAPIEDALA